MARIRIPRWAKWVTAASVLYLGICFIIANYLVEFAVHPTRIPVPEQAWRTVTTKIQLKNAVLENTEIKTRDGVMLKAWYVQPNPWSGKTVILLHGVGDNRQGVVSYGLFLAQNGFAFLAPDLRDHGDSGGNVFSYGVKEAEDVHEWGDWLWRTQKPNCLYGLGESIGAA